MSIELCAFRFPAYREVDENSLACILIGPLDLCHTKTGGERIAASSADPSMPPPLIDLALGYLRVYVTLWGGLRSL